MKINYNEKKIEMTKKEAKEAAKYGSETYKALIKIKRDLSDFTITVSDLSHKSANKGFSYDKMEMYVTAFGTDSQKEQFKSMRSLAKGSMKGVGNAYKEIKAWFNETFPEASDFSVAKTRITATSAS